MRLLSVPVILFILIALASYYPLPHRATYNPNKSPLENIADAVEENMTQMGDNIGERIRKIGDDLKEAINHLADSEDENRIQSSIFQPNSPYSREFPSEHDASCEYDHN